MNPSPQQAVTSTHPPHRSRPAVRNIDGVIAGPRPAPGQPVRHHVPKPHLQPHPMLRQHMDFVPVKPAGVTPVVGQHRPPQPIAPAGLNSRLRQPQPQADGQLRQPLADIDNGFFDHIHLKKSTILGVALAAILMGLSMFSLQLGELVLAVYAVVAIWRKLSSRLSFVLALSTFGGIIVTQLVSPESGIADNLAVYAFLLLCIGTISLAREVRSHDSSQPSNGGSLSKSL